MEDTGEFIFPDLESDDELSDGPPSPSLLAGSDSMKDAVSTEAVEIVVPSIQEEKHDDENKPIEMEEVEEKHAENTEPLVITDISEITASVPGPVPDNPLVLVVPTNAAADVLSYPRGNHRAFMSVTPVEVAPDRFAEMTLEITGAKAHIGRLIGRPDTVAAGIEIIVDRDLGPSAGNMSYLLSKHRSRYLKNMQNLPGFSQMSPEDIETWLIAHADPGLDEFTFLGFSVFQDPETRVRIVSAGTDNIFIASLKEQEVIYLNTLRRPCEILSLFKDVMDGYECFQTKNFSLYSECRKVRAEYMDAAAVVLDGGLGARILPSKLSNLGDAYEILPDKLYVSLKPCINLSESLKKFHDKDNFSDLLGQNPSAVQLENFLQKTVRHGTIYSSIKDIDDESPIEILHPTRAAALALIRIPLHYSTQLNNSVNGIYLFSKLLLCCLMSEACPDVVDNMPIFRTTVLRLLAIMCVSFISTTYCPDDITTGFLLNLLDLMVRSKNIVNVVESEELTQELPIISDGSTPLMFAAAVCQRLLPVSPHELSYLYTLAKFNNISFTKHKRVNTVIMPFAAYIDNDVYQHVCCLSRGVDAAQLYQATRYNPRIHLNEYIPSESLRQAQHLYDVCVRRSNSVCRPRVDAKTEMTLQVNVDAAWLKDIFGSIVFEAHVWQLSDDYISEVRKGDIYNEPFDIKFSISRMTDDSPVIGDTSMIRRFLDNLTRGITISPVNTLALKLGSNTLRAIDNKLRFGGKSFYEIAQQTFIIQEVQEITVYSKELAILSYSSADFETNFEKKIRKLFNLYSSKTKTDILLSVEYMYENNFKLVVANTSTIDFFLHLSVIVPGALRNHTTSVSEYFVPKLLLFRHIASLLISMRIA